MQRKCSKPLFATMGAIVFFALASPAASQTAADGMPEVYQREVFGYSGYGRVDPFKSLVRQSDLGVRLEDLALRGIVYNNDPAQSVAVLTVEGSAVRIQARTNQRVGTVRILAIRPDRVEVAVEELGVSRSETLRIEKKETPESTQ
jgi:hypothetical protein